MFCPLCGKPLINRPYGSKYCSKECYYKKNKSQAQERYKRLKKWKNCANCGKEITRVYHSKFCDEICLRQYYKSYLKSYKIKNALYLQEYRKKRNLKLKMQVLNRYSHDTPKCACCGENHFEFLTIDHINGDGSLFKTQHGRISGMNLYKQIIEKNYPKDLQILCFNCNRAKNNNIGLCPVHHPESFIQIKKPHKEYPRRESTLKHSKEYYQKLKLEILQHYSKDNKCACCGEDHIEFLTIDHKNNNGKSERKKYGYGVHFYRWLKSNNFPPFYQVLCMNCNFIKGVQDKPFCRVHHPELYEIHS